MGNQLPVFLLEGPPKGGEERWRGEALDLIVSEMLRRGHARPASRLLASHYRLHDRPTGCELRGAPGWRIYMQTLQAAFPDVAVQVTRRVVAGDDVSTHYVLLGTQVGDWGAVPASGRRVLVSGVLLSRFDGARIVEEWNDYDRRALRRQMSAHSWVRLTARPYVSRVKSQIAQCPRSAVLGGSEHEGHSAGRYG